MRGHDSGQHRLPCHDGRYSFSKHNPYLLYLRRQLRSPCLPAWKASLKPIRRYRHFPKLGICQWTATRLCFSAPIPRDAQPFVHQVILSRGFSRPRCTSPDSLRYSNFTQTQRVKALRDRWPSLEASQAPFTQKGRALAVAAWPAALHGVCVVPLGDCHFTTMRAAAFKGINHKAPGADRMLQLGLGFRV